MSRVPRRGADRTLPPRRRPADDGRSGRRRPHCRGRACGFQCQRNRHRRRDHRRGIEPVLEHYGTCAAITAFEHLASDAANRVAAAEALVRRLHEELVAGLRADIAQRGQPLPREGAPIAELVAGRPWLFADDAYHIDISHLNARVRIAPLLEDPATIALAVGLTNGT